MWNVWRTVLEENEKLARARLAAVEVFQQQIADDAKILRTHKIQTAKKVDNSFYIINYHFSDVFCYIIGKRFANLPVRDLFSYEAIQQNSVRVHIE